MKTETIFSVICIVIGILCGVFISNANNIGNVLGVTQSLCVKQKTFATEAVEEFIQENIPENYTVRIAKVNRLFELSESPTRLGTNMYDNIKNGAICKSNVTAIIKNKSNQQEITTDIDIRYQLADALLPQDYIYINMSGPDLEEASDEINKKIHSMKKNTDFLY